MHSSLDLFQLRFGDLTQHIMESKKLKARELATALGTTLPTFNDYCNARTVPTTEVILNLIIKFRVSADYLFTGAGTKFANTDIQEAIDELKERVTTLEREVGIKPQT